MTKLDDLTIDSPTINTTNDPQNDEWTRIQIDMPKSFEPVWHRTIQALQVMLETDSVFPCVEAMVAETHAAIPVDILTTLDQNVSRETKTYQYE